MIVTAASEKVRRGRPAITHDNTRVQAFVCNFDSLYALIEALPRLNDTLTGITFLQTKGQASTRPLSKRMLLRALRGCQVIAHLTVDAALGRGYSRTAVARYTAAARVASKAIDRLLDQFPEWEALAAELEAEPSEYDVAYFFVE